MNIDEMIAMALEDEFEERVEHYSTDTKKHRFSLAYRLWEYKTLRNLKTNRNNNRWSLRKARYAVTSAIIAASLLIGGTVYATIAAAGRYDFEDKSEYSKLFIEKLSSDKTHFEEYYGLPEEGGWGLIKYDISLNYTMLIYQHGDVEISFEQDIIRNGSMGQINTEKTAIEPVSLYEENDGFLMDFGDEILLHWIYDGYLLSIHGKIDKDEAIKLANSTKIIELQKNS